MAIPRLLRELGADPEPILAEVGIDPGLFDDPENRISYLKRGELIEHCARRVACPHFGLLLGEHGGLSSLGLAGLLARYSDTVAHALNSLARHFHLHANGATISTARHGRLAVFEYQAYEPGASGDGHIGDGAVAFMFNVMKELCGENWTAQEVRFAHRRPQDVSPYRAFFEAPLRFDAEQYAVWFDANWLEHRVRESNPELLRLIQSEIDQVELHSADPFPDQVRRLLRATLLTGHASAEETAAMFGITTRTLHRRLSQWETNFRELAADIRFEIARHLLEDTDIGITQLADLLGYSNASAFSRAFRAWSSMTPTEWRATDL
ncbi:MAG: AraC family transcriptional regulator [Xanthomonadales bacterium]|jgi:AraC-like DNA-binding protein|nr:AraC family transcriptional regulator [Xanthomonadales bacterium]